jgi:hypothetical protein
MANYIAPEKLNGGGFGGGFIAGRDGKILKEKLLFEEGIIFWDQNRTFPAAPTQS